MSCCMYGPRPGILAQLILEWRGGMVDSQEEWLSAASEASAVSAMSAALAASASDAEDEIEAAPPLYGHMYKKSPSFLRVRGWDFRFFVLADMKLLWWKSKQACLDTLDAPEDLGSGACVC